MVARKRVGQAALAVIAWLHSWARAAVLVAVPADAAAVVQAVEVVVGARGAVQPVDAPGKLGRPVSATIRELLPMLASKVRKPWKAFGA